MKSRGFVNSHTRVSFYAPPQLSTLPECQEAHNIFGSLGFGDAGVEVEIGPLGFLALLSLFLREKRGNSRSRTFLGRHRGGGVSVCVSRRERESS